MKKCPPGVICIENITMFFTVICVLLVTYFFYSRLFNQTTQKVPREKDVLLNPYYRDERYFMPELNYIPPGSVPINIHTTAVETTYRQVGILTPLNGNEKNNILPLMGRILFNRRDLWNYYTISNQHNNVKLPISVKGRSALTENGVDKVYNGDTVYVEGVNDAYKVTIYDNDTIRYLPFI